MKREYDNPFTNPKVIEYYHNLGKEDAVEQMAVLAKQAEWHAVVAATAMIAGGSLLVLLGLVWYFI